MDFYFLFILVWWSWIDTTFYSNKFYSDNLRHRLLLLLQIGGAGAMAAIISAAFNNIFSGFAISHVYVCLILKIEYVCVFRAINPQNLQSFSKKIHNWFYYCCKNLVYLCFCACYSNTFALWIIGLIIDFVTPITAGKLHSQFAPHVYPLPEWMGLFRLIVLNESMVSIVIGMTDQV